MAEGVCGNLDEAPRLRHSDTFSRSDTAPAATQVYLMPYELFISYSRKENDPQQPREGRGVEFGPYNWRFRVIAPVVAARLRFAMLLRGGFQAIAVVCLAIGQVFVIAALVASLWRLARRKRSVGSVNHSTLGTISLFQFLGLYFSSQGQMTNSYTMLNAPFFAEFHPLDVQR
ncbi:MAG TPA: hypothetical protein VMN36_01430 [Verrucomicrobiales bacterium]|nr:hypothetical protein [Verrucomicrobiales bacterium]